MTGPDFIKMYNKLVSFMVAGEFRPAHGQRRGGLVRFVPARITEAEEHIQWMIAHEFCIPMYLSGAFGSHRWCYQPLFKRLQNKRYIEAYRDGAAAFWYEITSRTLELKTHLVRPSEELVKKRFHQEGRLQLCKVHADSGGFNSHSEYCQKCPEREGCQRDRRTVQV